MTKKENTAQLTFNFRNNRFCCRFRMEGLVSNEWGRFLFLAETMAAAAAIPTGPEQWIVRQEEVRHLQQGKCNLLEVNNFLIKNNNNKNNKKKKTLEAFLCT